MLSFFLHSCTEKIDINLEEGYDRLVVEGEVTNEAKTHTVRLSKSTDFFNPESADVISDAIVILSDGIRKDTLSERANDAGIYETPEDYIGIPGRVYTLDIQLAEPLAGEDTFSASCPMPPLRTLDSIRVVYKSRWDSWQVHAYAQEPPTEDFYRFDLYKNGELVTDTIDESFVTGDDFFNGQYTNGISIGYFQIENPQEVVHLGDTIKARISSITEEHYTYLVDVIDESGFNNPLFEGPPSNIRGNISNGGIGFFAATAVNYATTTYEGDKIE